VLKGTGADILQLCDGRHTVAEIVTELGERYRSVPDDEVQRFLTRLVARRCVELADG
jgi:pyrroloquinoline quinone biosynthesis protein D